MYCLSVVSFRIKNHVCFPNLCDYTSCKLQLIDRKAFLRAWEDLCEVDDEGEGLDGPPKIEVPGGRTFKLKPVHFQGPCKSKSVQVQVRTWLISQPSPFSDLQK